MDIRPKRKMNASNEKWDCITPRSYPVASGEKTTGLTIERIKREIQSLPINRLGVSRAYGFGSFFRQENYHDIDILLVVSPIVSSSATMCRSIRRSFSSLAIRIGATFDLTILTEHEFARRPLRDMDELQLISI